MERADGAEPPAQAAWARALRPAAPAASVLLILLVAAGLRFAGLDWDQGHLFHPDERRILDVVSKLHWPRAAEWSQVLGPRSPLNPRFFAYGSLPLYLLRLAGAVSGLGASRLYLAGRVFSAGCDLLTVATVYALGRRQGGRLAGVLAAAFLAVAVLPIQLSHYATVDALLALLTTVAVWALIRVGESGSLRAGLAGAVLTGLALATKTSALPLLFSGWVAWAVWSVQATGVPRLGRGFLGLALGTAAAGLTFVVAEPYSLIDWFRFSAAQVQESIMARGSMILPYTQQYVGTTPYLYQVRELVLWSLGVPLGLLALAGLAWLSWRGLRLRRPADLVLLSWFWSYFLLVGAFHAKFTRYLAPLVPWLCLMAGLLLARLCDRLRGRPWPRRLTAGLAAIVLLPTLLYALATATMYLRRHPWLRASDWIYRQVPAGSVLIVEEWDDTLPVPLGGARPDRYRQLKLDLYQPDSPAKLERLLDALSQADYIILASQRQYAALSRLAQEYPLTAAYYRLLFGEQLGYRLVEVATNYPRLGPLALVDEPLVGTALPRPALLGASLPAPVAFSFGRADESYSVYDHPRALIFKKVKPMPRPEYRALLLGGG